MCNMEYDAVRGEMVQAGTFRSPVAVALYFGFILHYITQYSYSDAGSFVANFSVIGNYVITNLTILLLVVEQFLRRRKWLTLGRLMLSYVTCRNELFKEIPTFNLGLVLILLQITTVVGSYTLLFVLQLLKHAANSNFLETIASLITSMANVYVNISLVFVQFFAHFVCWEMQQLTLHLKTCPIGSLLDASDRLVKIKRAIAETLGVRLLLALFHLLVKVSFFGYLGLVYCADRRISDNFWFEVIHVMATVLINNSAVLLGVSYSFDCVERKVGTLVI